MSWIQVRATFPEAADLSPYIEVFRHYGIENTLEEAYTLVGCLPRVAGSGVRASELEAALGQAGAQDVAISELQDESWETNWMQFFKPRRVGKRIVVRPTWEQFDRKPDDIEIVLDPGQAFGTGDHPTTRLCMELMQDAPLSSLVVADVGCGSGILSIAACKLGARSVVAIDIEPVAVEVARLNAALNEVTFDAVVGEGIDGLPMDAAPFDLVVSNIISAIIIRLACDVAAVLKDGGLWIVSGIIVQNWPDVLEAAERSGFMLDQRREEDGWVAARLHKR
jgi:ribosomal protein L11 methyltransferase